MGLTGCGGTAQRLCCASTHVRVCCDVECVPAASSSPLELEPDKRAANVCVHDLCAIQCRPHPGDGACVQDRPQKLRHGRHVDHPACMQQQTGGGGEGSIGLQSDRTQWCRSGLEACTSLGVCVSCQNFSVACLAFTVDAARLEQSSVARHMMRTCNAQSVRPCTRGYLAGAFASRSSSSSWVSQKPPKKLLAIVRSKPPSTILCSCGAQQDTQRAG